jgi:hypothetical protein
MLADNIERPGGGDTGTSVITTNGLITAGGGAARRMGQTAAVRLCQQKKINNISALAALPVYDSGSETAALRQIHWIVLMDSDYIILSRRPAFAGVFCRRRIAIAAAGPPNE